MIEQHELDDILQKYHIQPVGNGYIDCICPEDNIISFIDEITAHGIRIIGFTWWCFVSNGHELCGMGGPQNEYDDGWFSEIAMFDVHEFGTNEEIKNYLTNVWRYQNGYKSCFVPAFYLDVPDKWRRAD